MRRNHSLLPNVLTTSVLLGIAITLALAAPTANAEVITVCWDGSGDYLTIQEGIDAASDADEVVVCDGVYTGPGNKNLDFGGKAITVRSANGPENCIIDCQNDGRGFYFHSGETSEAIVDGFTIMNGYAYLGAGVSVSSSSPTIRNCTITGNTATANGGGLACGLGSPVISNCTITQNTAEDLGGGVACEEDAATISDCTIAENTAQDGGGLWCWGNTTIIDCTVTENTATDGPGGLACGEETTIIDCTIRANLGGYDSAGGLACGGDSTITGCTILENLSLRNGGGIECHYGNPTISHCAIAGNTTMGSGGGVYCPEGSPRIVNCLILGNTALGAWPWSYGGGGICCERYYSGTISNCKIAANTGTNGGAICAYAADVTIVNCVITANAAYDGGGAVFCFASDVTLTDCTLAVNAAGSRGGAVCSSSGSQTIVANSILWADTALVGPEMALRGGSQVTVSYCDVQGGSSAADVGETCTLNWGAGNIDADPLFADPENHVYRVAAGSPCIDAACNWGVPADTSDLDDDGDTNEITPLDLDGEGRFFDDPDTFDTGCGCPPIVDMGAFEFGDTGPQPCPGDLDCDRTVGHSDLAILLAAWHTSNEGDLNCDGLTDHADLGILLGHWGEGCP